MLSDDALYQEIFDAIIARRLPPGSKLTEATLCEIFGVKRNTVRKALAQLAAKKMVDLHFNRGAYVASPTEEEARDIFEVRRVLEADLVATLAARPVRPDLSAIRDGVRQERDSFLHQDFPGWIRRSLDFHTHLVRLSGNQVMADYVEDLVYRAPLISALYDPMSNCCSFDEHDAILDSIASGDARRASEQMSAHLQLVEHKLTSRASGHSHDTVLEQVFRPATTAYHHKNREMSHV